MQSEKTETKNAPIFVAFDLDELQNRLHGAIQLLRHSYYGITASGCEPDERDFDALFSLFCYLQSIDDELSAKIDELQDSIYAAKNKPSQKTSNTP